MRVSDEQVERSLAALRVEPECLDDEQAERRRTVRHHDGGDAGASMASGLLAALRDAPAVRAAEVARVKAALEGSPPTSDDVATKLVGRLVCDRLR